jgi:hypothetical protein
MELKGTTMIGYRYGALVSNRALKADLGCMHAMTINGRRV